MTNDNKKDISAEELMRRLNEDPEYQKKMAEKQKRKEKKISLNKQAFAFVTSDLRNIGVEVSSINDLTVNYSPLSEAIIEVLLKWIPIVEQVDIQDGLIRALCLAEKPFDGKVLTNIFETVKGLDASRIRWSIANTIDAVQPNGISDWIERTLINSKYGFAREMLCLAIVKMQPYEKAVDILKTVFDDLSIHATEAFKEIGQDQSIIDFLTEKHNEFEHALQNEKLSKLNHNRYKATVKSIPKVIRKIEKRIEKK